MNIVSKAVIGISAAGAMALASATPAMAQSRDRDRGGISAGEIIAGALIIGGIAAVASSASRNSNNYYDPRYSGGYGRGWDNPRVAVEQCVRAAERDASRASYRGRAEVIDIRQIRDTRRGWRVEGRIAVNTMGRDWRRGDPRYGRGWNNDYRGWNDRRAGYDAGRFTCEIRDGRIHRVNFSGIRGL